MQYLTEIKLKLNLKQIACFFVVVVAVCCFELLKLYHSPINLIIVC